MRREAALQVMAVLAATIATAASVSVAIAQPTTDAVPTLDPPAWSFGPIAVGMSVDHEFTLSGQFRGAEIADGPDKEHFSVAPTYCAAMSSSCAITVSFGPKAVGQRQALLDVRAKGQDGDVRLSAKLRGTAIPPPAAALAVSTDPVVFDPAERGIPAAVRTVTVSSTGTATLSLGVISVEGGDFHAETSDCRSRPLKPTETCTISVRFTPLDTGERTGTLFIENNTADPRRAVALRGAGIPAAAGVVVTPPALRFTDVPLGTVRRDAVKITNTGRRAFAVEKPSLQGDEEFTVVQGACQDMRIEPQASCELSVAFTPTSAGMRRATVSIPFTDGLPRQQVELVGETITAASTTTSTPVTAPPGPVALVVNPSAARPGTTATVTGDGYRGETRLYWQTKHESTMLVSTAADGRGRIEAVVTVPADAGSGSHQIIGCDETDVCAAANLTLIGAHRDRRPGWAIALVAILLVVAAAASASAVVRRGGRGGKGSKGPGTGGGLLPGERAVFTGFSPAEDPMTPLDETESLVAGRPYHFWLELGPPAAGAGGGPVALNVVLFGYEGEFDIVSSVGELELAPGGAASVVYQGGVHRAGMLRAERSGARLLFPVQTPRAPGTHRIRCSLYHRQVLVQSWVVSARVEAPTRRWLRRRSNRQELAVHRERDYVLARSLDPAHLDRLAPHRLSVMLNANGDGNHSLRLFGEGGFQSTWTISATKLASLSHELRTVLEDIAAERRPGGGLRYRYDGPVTVERLGGDLIRLARWGWSIFVELIDRLDGMVLGTDPMEGLRELLCRPGRIQVANKEDSTDVVPAAFLYDRPLDPDVELALCSAFVEALGSGEPLESSVCFQGACPNPDPEIVCPAGFWGFRHVIGVPQSLGRGDGAPLDVRLDGGDSLDPTVPVGLSTDPGFSRLKGHRAALEALDPTRPWLFLDSRKSLLTTLAQREPQLVYLYCHGGTDSGRAYIQVGSLDEDPISGAALAGRGIRWPQSRTLVFVNGCHTAAVGPETPLQLVTVLVRRLGATGVIGTQVTVFEPLACAFAESFLRSLLVDGESVGTAVRVARMALLQQGNPLGLVYIPFVSDEVRIAGSPAALPSDGTWLHA